jgi:hypothetical protein
MGSTVVVLVILVTIISLFLGLVDCGAFRPDSSGIAITQERYAWQKMVYRSCLFWIRE